MYTPPPDKKRERERERSDRPIFLPGNRFRDVNTPAATSIFIAILTRVLSLPLSVYTQQQKCNGRTRFNVGGRGLN